MVNDLEGLFIEYKQVSTFLVENLSRGLAFIQEFIVHNYV